jgi:hypothetical protein
MEPIVNPDFLRNSMEAGARLYFVNGQMWLERDGVPVVVEARAYQPLLDQGELNHPYGTIPGPGERVHYWLTAQGRPWVR